MKAYKSWRLPFSRSCRLADINGTTTQVPSYPCQVTATHLKIDTQIYKWFAVTWLKNGISLALNVMNARAERSILKYLYKYISPISCHCFCQIHADRACRVKLTCLWMRYDSSILNPLWPSDAFGRHRSGSSLPIAMFCCLTTWSNFESSVLFCGFHMTAKSQYVLMNVTHNMF